MTYQNEENYMSEYEDLERKSYEDEAKRLEEEAAYESEHKIEPYEIIIEKMTNKIKND